MSINVNSNTPNPQQSNNKNTPANADKQTAAGTTTTKSLEITRELDGVNDTGIIGEVLTIGTDQVGEANRFFTLNKFVTTGLLSEENQAVSTDAHFISTAEKRVLSEDDMFIAGDPIVGGKGNNYVPITVIPEPGFYTMFEDGGVNGGQKVTVNSHVEKINPEGNVALTEYGFILQDENGIKTKATLSGGEFTIESPSGHTQKILPPNDIYTIGNPSDPVARFYYTDIPGAGENGAPEKRLVMDYFERPNADTIKKMTDEGVAEDQASALRSKTSMNFGFRIPDGVNTFASPEGVGAGTKVKVADNGVKTYYDAHFLEGKSSVVKASSYTPPEYPPEEPPEYPPEEPPEYPPKEPPEYPPEPPKEYPIEKARIWGDPHIIGADGGKYDFQEIGIYNILKDSNITVNSRMEKFGTGRNGKTVTVNTEAGLTLGSKTILVKADGTTTIGDTNSTTTQELKKGESLDLGNGHSVKRDGNNIQVNATEYTLEVQTNKGRKNKFLDIDIWSKTGGVLSDGIAPSGLLGETFDEDNIAQTKTQNSAESYRESSILGPVFQPAASIAANTVSQDKQVEGAAKPKEQNTLPPTPLELELPPPPPLPNKPLVASVKGEVPVANEAAKNTGTPEANKQPPGVEKDISKPTTTATGGTSDNIPFAPPPFPPPFKPPVTNTNQNPFLHIQTMLNQLFQMILNFFRQPPQ